MASYRIKFLILLLALYTSHAIAGPIKVAVVDSGIDTSMEVFPLCDSGHKDFSGENSIKDKHPKHHGTNVAGLIKKNAYGANYCIVVIKIFKGVDSNSIVPYIRALHYMATELHPDVVNLSLAGYGQSRLEKLFLAKLLNDNVKIVAAAGNDGLNLDFGCNIFPACSDPRILVIGNSGSSNSNTGKVVDFFLDGQSQEAGGYILSGSSQSAAIFTGKLVRGLDKEKKDKLMRWPYGN